jgi:hypothetical protein
MRVTSAPARKVWTSAATAASSAAGGGQGNFATGG